MLVLAALLVSMNLGFLVEQSLHRAENEREQKILEAHAAELLRGGDVRAFSRSESVRELQQRQLRRLVFPVLCPLCLLVIAALLYLDHPVRIRRRRHAQPVTATDAPRVVAFVQRWAESLGLQRLRLEYQHPGLAQNAEAFGLRGREVVLLYGHPRLWERVWGPSAQSVVLHEMGHIVNEDSQAREKTRALWLALFLLLAAVFSGLALSAHLESLSGTGWRIAVLLLIVATILAGVVRARELHADQRVVAWGYTSTLEQLFLTGSPADRSPLSWRRRWTRLREEGLKRTYDRAAHWITHPPHALRAKAVTDPAELFRVSPHLAFVTGVLLSILVVNFFAPMTEAVRALSPQLSSAFWSVARKELPATWANQPFPAAKLPLLGALTLFLVGVGGTSYLLAGVLGIQVQREAVADLAKSKPTSWGYGRLWWPALLLPLGLEAGFVIAPFKPDAPFSLRLDLLAPWLAGLTCFTWLWLAYVRALTRFTLGLRAGAVRPRPLQGLTNTPAAIVLSLLYCPAAFWRVTHAFWARNQQWGMVSADPREFYVYMYVGTGMMLLIVAIALYIIYASVTLGIAGLRLWRWRARCPTCDQPIALSFTLGRRCTYCGGPLALWACPEEPYAHAIPQEATWHRQN